MTLWSASHRSNMVVVLVATCQDLAENGLPQLMPSPARPISHVGSLNKVKIISKESRWKVQRRELLRFENVSTESDVQTRTGVCLQNNYHLIAFDLDFIPYERRSCVLQYTIVHSFTLLQFTVWLQYMWFSFLYTFHCETLFDVYSLMDQPVIPSE